MESAKQRLIVVSGPTACGKTSLGIALAKAFSGEIVSADSMQIYRGIPIATAQPSDTEKSGIPHHLMGFLDVGTLFSVADYCDMAHSVIKEIGQRGKLPIMVGGTGLYIDSVADDVKFSDCGSTEIRDRLQEEYKEAGIEPMYQKLLQVDPVAAEKIDKENIRRVIRALEVFYATGIPFSRHVELSKAQPSRYKVIRLNIAFKDREKLYNRINQRVDRMFSAGLLGEAIIHRERMQKNGAGQAIGHKELYPYIDGEITLAEAAENLKRATRRYAKRQITWFSRNQKAHTLYADCEDICQKAKCIIESEGLQEYES